MDIHTVNVGLFRVDQSNNVIRNSNTLKSSLVMGHDHRIITDSAVPNSAGYPTVKQFLTSEAADNYQLITMNQTSIVTGIGDGWRSNPYTGGGGSPIKQGMTVFWPLSEASGDRVDTVGSLTLEEQDISVTLESIPSTDGHPDKKVDRAADFYTPNQAVTGANRLYLPGDDSALQPGSGKFSFAVWIYPRFSLVRPVLGFRPYTVTNGGIGWYLQWNGSLDSFQFAYSTTGTNQNTLNSATASGNEEGWNLVIVTQDDTRTKLYVNGSLEDNEPIFGTYYDSTGDFTMGGYNDRRDGFWRFDGYIQDFAWWDRDLTLEETDQLWNNGDGINLG